MTELEKVSQLAAMVDERLLPLIDHDYVLYGLPNYSNVGDLLIWEGVLEFLKNVPYKCKGVCAWNEYPTNPLAGDSIILIQGGGYFGDVWRKAWKHVLDGIRPYRNNKIILLPMSIYYEDDTLRKADADYLAEFKDLTICARDEASFLCAKTGFLNQVLLVPDMAWHIGRNYLARWSQPSSGKILLLKRTDKELDSEDIHIPGIQVDIHDWPTIETLTPSEIRFKKYIRLVNKFQRKLPRMRSLFQNLKDRSYDLYYRNQMNSRGISFISSYETIYTTRLHGLILSVLLGKEVYFIDNSYGKLSSCYSTWLKDVDRVHLFEKKDNDAQKDFHHHPHL